MIRLNIEYAQTKNGKTENRNPKLETRRLNTEYMYMNIEQKQEDWIWSTQKLDNNQKIEDIICNVHKQEEWVSDQGCVQYRNCLQTFRNRRVLEIGNFAKRFDTERSPGL